MKSWKTPALAALTVLSVAACNDDINAPEELFTTLNDDVAFVAADGALDDLGHLGDPGAFRPGGPAVVQHIDDFGQEPIGTFEAFSVLRRLRSGRQDRYQFAQLLPKNVSRNKIRNNIFVEREEIPPSSIQMALACTLLLSQSCLDTSWNH